LIAAFDNRLVLENFQNTKEKTSKPQLLSFEGHYMLDMNSGKSKAWTDGHKETFMNALFFYKLQSHLIDVSADLESRL
jgi:hypothetical protein